MCYISFIISFKNRSMKSMEDICGRKFTMEIVNMQEVEEYVAMKTTSQTFDV